MTGRVTCPWDIWGGQGWPANADQEQQFVDDARAAAGDVTVDMDDVTPIEVVCLMTALRVGATATQVLDRAPGLHPSHLVAAHTAIARRVRTARNAWTTIVENPTPETIDDAAADAAPLVGLLVTRLAAVGAATPDLLIEEAARVAGRTLGLQKLSDDVERRLAGLPVPSEVGVNLGRQLFDPGRSCLWSSPMFVPVRVGQLSPVRVSDLLGWRRDDPRQL